MDQFLTDVKKLRDNARKNMEKGAVTDSYKADVKQVLKVLNDVLATELVCVLRYKRHYYMAQGINSDSVKAEFLQHANEEQQHADWIAERITQLGGEPDFRPTTLADRSASEYAEGKSLVDMIKEDLVAERIAIQTLFGNHPMAGRRRSDHQDTDRADQQGGRRARQRHVGPARQDGLTILVDDRDAAEVQPRL